jgi:site-specific DNA recombinase
MKAIIIARVSTEEQKEMGLSLPAQIVRLEKYCQSKGFAIIKSCSFDESAYKSQRDEFDTILDFVLEQKNKIAVCFDKVDRLTRDTFDRRIGMLYDKALRDELELHFVSDGQILNSKISATQKFQFGITLNLSKYFSDAISDNVNRANEQKWRKGEWTSKAPYGYKNIVKPDSKKEIVVDEQEAYIVKKAFEWYATGIYSLELLRAKLKSEFGVKWIRSFVDKLLKRHFYYGVMEVKGKMFPHCYPPLISKTLFDQVQQVKSGFNKNNKYKYAGLPFMYRGLLRCGDCGLAITPERHKGYVYYHCTQYNGKHGAKWLREEEITEQIGKVFQQIQLPPEIFQEITNTLNKVHRDKIEFHNKHFDKLTAEQKSITKMMDNLYLDKLKGEIDDKKYNRFYTSLRSQMDEITARLGRLQEAEDNYYVTAKYILELSNRAYDLFKSSEVEQKRQLIKLVLSNLRIEGENVLYDAQKPFDVLIKNADCVEWRP